MSASSSLSIEGLMKMPYIKEEINKIVGLKGVDGKPIDIFDLHGGPIHWKQRKRVGSD